MRDPFGALTDLCTPAGDASFFRLGALEERGVAAIGALPFSIRVLLEAALRACATAEANEDDVVQVARWADGRRDVEVPFLPARILLQDLTGVAVLADLAAMRSALARLSRDPRLVEPLLPSDLVVDHSVQVDVSSSPDALRQNTALEFARNGERYAFLRWAQRVFSALRVVPPGTGIVHQVNLEHLARVVFWERSGDRTLAWPDSVLGTDSHTPMVNALGVLGWGVGGIEAEAAMLGRPLSMLLPGVLGVRLTGRLPTGATATDLALTVTKSLRARGVVGRFVEFFGRGLEAIPLPDRATVANMAPEYGATVGFFPLDREALGYLARTGRSAAHVERVEAYARAQGLLRDEHTPDPAFDEVFEFDLGSVEPCVAGPKRPQDLVPLRALKEGFRAALIAPVERRGYGLAVERLDDVADVAGAAPTRLRHGSVILAAITSCTNTSNPALLLGAGLVAKKAVERGLTVPPTVKASLTPGSRVAARYLERAGLLPHLEALGFHVAGYGCATCIGNSGPIAAPVATALEEGGLVGAAVLSGNRNFEGRIHPSAGASWLASPPLVVAFALAGRVDLDLEREPLGHGADGAPVFLRDLWPTPEEIATLLTDVERAEDYLAVYERLDGTNPAWEAIRSDSGDVFRWDPASTYLQEPPFLVGLADDPAPIAPILGARALAVLGDSVTTDHISPAGDIAPGSPAALYLESLGVARRDFNTYGARRGNDRVMARGTFANTRLKNRLADGREGGVTVHLPDGAPMAIWEAACRYRAQDVPLLILAGREYGTGSSRDWAAKGTLLLGVRAVLAESFERIHRANLVGMGVLPLQFMEGANLETLGLTGRERFDVLVGHDLRPRALTEVRAHAEDGSTRSFLVLARLDTPRDLELYRHGGILPAGLRRILAETPSTPHPDRAEETRCPTP